MKNSTLKLRPPVPRRIKAYIAEEIASQKDRELSSPGKVHALETPINAEKHIDIYKMHRYFARRPWNVFEHIIKHYTRPGQIILDPFCGGGVAVVEGLKLRRKVIGVDLNPMAIYITKMEVMHIDIYRLDEAFKQVESEIKDNIIGMYKTKCRDCGSNSAFAKWYKWSNTFICPNCGMEVVAALAKKLGGGIYECKHCKSKVIASLSKRVTDQLISLSCFCPECEKTQIVGADKNDIALAKNIEHQFESVIEKEHLWFPMEEFPDCDRERDDALREKGITHFHKIFTKRNLLLNARLYKLLNEIAVDAEGNKVRPDIKEMLRFVFTSRLAWTSKMVSSTTHGWQHHGYWMPNIYFEMNVWKMFHQGYEKGQSTILRGKLQSEAKIGQFAVLSKNFNDLKTGKSTCFLLTQSSHKLPLPDNSVDVIITDPPFGGNVQYTELSNFWWIWFGKGLIDNSYEAVQSRHADFPTAKSEEHYEEMLYSVFKECHRVLKNGGWMVMTFHNRNLRVWMSLHRAARRAGFKLPSKNESSTRGIVYQPPIERYTTTLHQRAKGSMLGDFILSFKRDQKPLSVDGVLEHLSTDQEARLRETVESFLTYQGGTDENAIMTCLIPHFGEMGLLHRIGSHDFRGFLKKHFHYDKKTRKWYTFDQVELSEDQKSYTIRPLDYIPAENVVDNLIRSYFKEHDRATMDDILKLIYMQLVNSHRPNIEAITTVLDRICDLKEMPIIETPSKNKKFFVLKSDDPSKVGKEKVTHDIQLGLFGFAYDSIPSQFSHNEVIQLLYNYALDFGFSVHIGETEQKKVPIFKEISTPMNDRIFYGIPKETAFKRIKEIDILYLEDNIIRAAFEVTTSIGTASSAINDRYRNLFAVLPNIDIKCFVVIKGKDLKKASSILNSAANVRDGIAKKIRLVKITDLIEKKVQELVSS